MKMKTVTTTNDDDDDDDDDGGGGGGGDLDGLLSNAVDKYRNNQSSASAGPQSVFLSLFSRVYEVTKHESIVDIPQGSAKSGP